MKKIKSFTILLFITLGLSGCQKPVPEDRDIIYPEATLKLYKTMEEAGNFDRDKIISTHINKEVVISKKINLSEKGIKKIAGLDSIDNKIYVLDNENDTLSVLDESYNVIKTIGETGNEKNQFLNPTAITHNEKNELFVVDSGNKRVQKFDRNLDFIEERSFKTNQGDPKFQFNHIAVDKTDKIYLSGDTIEPAGIQTIDKEGKESWIKDYFSGVVVNHAGNVYAINFGEFFITDDNNLGYVTGKNDLFKIIDNKLMKQVTLPVVIGLLDFVMDDNNLYGYSSSFSEVLKISLDGKYEYSVTKFKRSDEQRNASMCLTETSKLLIATTLDDMIEEVTLLEK